MLRVAAAVECCVVACWCAALSCVCFRLFVCVRASLTRGVSVSDVCMYVCLSGSSEEGDPMQANGMSVCLCHCAKFMHQ